MSGLRSAVAFFVFLAAFFRAAFFRGVAMGHHLFSLLPRLTFDHGAEVGALVLGNGMTAGEMEAWRRDLAAPGTDLREST